MPERNLSLSDAVVGMVIMTIVGWFKIIRLTKCKAKQVLKTPKNKTKPNAQGEASRMKAPDNIKNLERYILKLHLKLYSSYIHTWTNVIPIFLVPNFVFVIIKKIYFNLILK